MGKHLTTIDVTIPGLGRGKVGTRRTENRLTVSAGTADPGLVAMRRAMIQELKSRVGGMDLLRGLYDRRFDVAELHRAYVQGSDALARLLELAHFPPLRESIDDFLSRCRARGKASYQQQLYRFADYLGPNATLLDVTTKNIAAFLEQLTAVGHRWKHKPTASNATRNRYRAAIAAMCSDAVRMGRMKEHPLAWRRLLPYDEGHRRLPDMSPTDYAKYLDAHESWTVKLFHRLLIHTGADVGEMLDLHVDECLLDRELPRLRFKRQKVRRSIERLVPIPASVADELREHIVGNGMVGRALVFHGVTDFMSRTAHEAARKAIGQPELRRKDFRHIAAIYWRRADVDLERIREWLGLMSIKQVQVYAAFGPDDKYDAPKIARATELLQLVK